MKLDINAVMNFERKKSNYVIVERIRKLKEEILTFFTIEM